MEVVTKLADATIKLEGELDLSPLPEGVMSMDRQPHL